MKSATYRYPPSGLKAMPSGKLSRFRGADLADVSALRRQHIDDRIRRGKPSPLGRCAAAVECQRDRKRSRRAHRQPLRRRSNANVIHQVRRIGLEIDDADGARAPIRRTAVALVRRQAETGSAVIWTL